MARLASRGLALAAVLALALALGGCARLPDWVPGGGRARSRSRPARRSRSISAPRRCSRRADPREAGEQFAEVERLYPYSEWAKRAMLMSAFAYHEGALYAESRAAAERYLEFFPADVDAPYAQFLIALSYYDQIVDIGRDQSNAFEALQEMRDIIERYPDSEYAKSAQLKFELALDHLAGKEMEIGRYYLARGHYTAAINRFRVVVEDYQTTTQTPEALHRLVESYLSLGLVPRRRPRRRSSATTSRARVWYHDSYALLTGRGLQPEDAGDSWLNQIYRQVVQGRWR